MPFSYTGERNGSACTGVVCQTIAQSIRIQVDWYVCLNYIVTRSANRRSCFVIFGVNSIMRVNGGRRGLHVSSALSVSEILDIKVSGHLSRF